MIAFILGIPGLTNQTVLSALFSLTATGLYSSYLIPILLRVTVARDTFEPKEFTLGKFSIAIGWVSLFWCILMVIVLCLPSVTPITIDNMNYSPVALGAILVFCWLYWGVSARHWFKGAEVTVVLAGDVEASLVTVIARNQSSGTKNKQSASCAPSCSTGLEVTAKCCERGDCTSGGDNGENGIVVTDDVGENCRQFRVETHTAHI